MTLPMMYASQMHRKKNFLRASLVVVKSVLKGFTLTNGVGPGPYYTDGGGVAIGYSSPTVTGNVIAGNVGNNGGGIGSSFGSPMITHNVIRHNKAAMGAGIFIGGASTPG